MFKTLYIREIQNYLYSLRFQVSFIIVLAVFCIGSVSFVRMYGELQANYARMEQSQQQSLDKRAGQGLTTVAISELKFIMAPRLNGMITDCKENSLPNTISYTAYRVAGFDVLSGNNNPLIVRSDQLSWAFIVSIFLSFITLLFAFDALSGEKEEHTLSLVFSNPVSRKIFLFSKLASIVTVVTLMEVVGIIVSLLILLFSGKIQIDGTFLIETAGFIGISILLITIFAVFGLLASALTPHSNVSLLVSLCFWLLSVVIIPNTAVFWANKLFSIPSIEAIRQAYTEERNDIIKHVPKGSFNSSSDPFFPGHKLRAEAQTKLMECLVKYEKYNADNKFRQFEKTRMLTLLSPIAQYDYINEAFIGGGYVRFRTNWDQLHLFQQQYLQWFKDLDAKDPNSPHWYNPEETYSTSAQPVAVNLIPRYREQPASFGQRFEFIGGYLIVMVCTIAVLFSICFFRFVRYDVR